jgi:DnaK suppressor protein
MPKVAQENLTTEKIGEFRRMLHEKETEVRGRLSAVHAAEVVQRPEEPLDFGDWCQKNHDEWLFLNQNRLEIALLRDVQRALRRVEAGTFGICPECNQAISPKRLEAVPWAKFCVACQERVLRS